MVETTVIRTIRVRGTSEGIEKLTGDLGKLAGAQENVAVVSEQSARRSLSVEQAWKKQTMAVDETARSQAKFAQQAKIADAALREGLINQAQHAERLQLISQRYGQQTAELSKLTAGMSAAAQASRNMMAGMSGAGRAADEAAKAAAAATAAGPGRLVAGMSAAGDVNAVASQRMLAGMASGGEQAARGIGLARHELINLSRQAQDVGVSLVSGQSPLMILAQQGSQIADVFIASGKSVGSFFSQAMGWARPFLTSTAGIVTGIAAIGVAASYAAVQFLKASTTVEEALEKQNRLLKEGKALIDQRTSAEARAQLNPRDLTEFEMKRNLLDLQRKLNDETRGALIRSAAPSRGIGDIRGEFSGEVPPLTPGMDKLIDAAVRLKAVQAAGLPGLKEFNAELARIGTAHPELAKTVEKMIELGQSGIELENAAMRAKAISDALKGVATNAQLAAVGLGSIAQFKLNNLQAEQARDATERQAVATLQLAQQYPGMSVEAAKQLNSLQGQLIVAQEITGLGTINAQHQVTINSLLLQGRTLTEAIAIADKQRAISLAQANVEADRMLRTLQQEGQLIRASSDAERDRIAARHAYDDLISKGVDSTKAQAVASQQLANAEARRFKAEEEAHDRAMSNIRTQADAWAAYKQGQISWSEANNEAGNILRKNEAAAEDAANAMLDYSKALQQAAIDAEFFTKLPLTFTIPLMNPYEMGKTAWEKGGQLTQYNPAGYTSQTPQTQSALFAATSMYGAGGFTQDPTLAQLGFLQPIPNAQGLEKLVNSGAGISALLSGLSSANTDLVQATAQILSRLTNLLPDDQKAAAIRQQIGALQGTTTLAGRELLQQLTDQLEQLTRATEENTSATQSMTDVLSPFYSSDPRRTYLGFRAFAGGGIMTDQGAMPLAGGIASSRQVAVFGEGATPEAFVPVPAGRIPVEIKQPANSNQRPVNVFINVGGNADQGAVAALRSTAFQQAQAMRRAMG